MLPHKSRHLKVIVLALQEIESHVSHAVALRSEYDALVDDNLVLAAVDDFCRLTVRHRVRKAIGSTIQYDSRLESDRQDSHRMLQRGKQQARSTWLMACK
jgi:hypothetical protein